MRLARLTAAACVLLAALPAFAQGKRLTTDSSAIRNESTSLCMDVAIGGSCEAVATTVGDLRAGRCIEAGGVAGAGSCICREASTDRLYADKDCDAAAKEAGEEYLDNAGGGGGVVDAEFIVGELHGTLSAEVAPSAASQVPVSSSSTAASWQQVPAAALADNACTEPKLDIINAPTDEYPLTYETTGARLEWQQLTAAGLADANVTEPKLDVRNSPVDEFTLTYEASDGRLEWQAQATPDACTGKTRCVVLSDVDADNDYADDFQKAINDLAYPNYTELVVNNETVASNSEGFFGITISASVDSAETYDKLNSTPIAILSGGTCSDGGSQTATINTNGTLTGASISSSSIVVTNQDMNCDDDGNSANCIAATGGDDFLNGPVELDSILCARSGATSANFDATGTACTAGSVSLCSATELGAITILWTAGTGDTTCTYNRKARNTVIYQDNGTANGRLIGRFASAPTGSVTCSYTAITSSNGGLSTEEFIIAPPVGATSLDFNSEVNYCRMWNSETPTGYGVPACTGGASQALIPKIIFDRSWDGVEIQCDPPLKGSGNPTWCFKVGSESVTGVSSADRPGILMQGAPIVHLSKTTVTPGASGDFHYGFFMDGVDDSLVRVRPKTTGDIDQIPLVFVGDTSQIILGSWSDDAVGSFGDVYVDGVNQVNGSVTILGDPPGSKTRHVDGLEIGSVVLGYKDPEHGYQTITTNGCSYKGTNTISTCDGMTLNGVSMTSMRTPGLPRDFQVVNAVSTGDIEFILNQDGSTFASFEGPTRVDCSDCEGLRLHAASGYQQDVEVKSDAFVISGLVDEVLNDAIGINPAFAGTSYRNFATMLLDGVVSRSATPYRMDNSWNDGLAGPGLLDVIGSPDYVWTVDGQGAVSANSYMKRGETFSTLSASASYDTVWENSSERTFLGRIKVELIEAVPNTSTECDVTIERAGLCTACGPDEPAGGFVFKYGGTDRWGRPLRSAGDYTWWGIMDAVTAGQDITAEVRPVSGGTACTAGSACTCNGMNALRVTVDELPALYDVP